MSETANSVESLAAVPLFQRLGRERIEALSVLCHRRQFKAGQAIIREGDIGDTLFIITSGTVRIEKSTGGEAHQVAIRHPGETIGELALIENRPRSASAVAQTFVRVLALSREDFRKHILSDPELTFGLMQTLSERLRESTQILVDRRAKSVEDRLADLMLWRADSEGEINLTWLSQQELAEMVGCTREAVNRAIHVLMDAGTITRLGRRRYAWNNRPAH